MPKTPIYHAARTALIGTIWGVIYLFILRAFMIAYWKFDISQALHWDYMIALWRSGWEIDTIYEISYFLTLFFVIPVWLAGWSFLDEVQWEKIFNINLPSFNLKTKNAEPQNVATNESARVIEPQLKQEYKPSRMGAISASNDVINSAYPGKGKSSTAAGGVQPAIPAATPSSVAAVPAAPGAIMESKQPSENFWNSLQELVGKKDGKEGSSSAARPATMGSPLASSDPIEQLSSKIGSNVGKAVGEKLSPSLDKLNNLLVKTDENRKVEHAEVMEKLDVALSASQATPKKAAASSKESVKKEATAPTKVSASEILESKLPNLAPAPSEVFEKMLSRAGLEYIKDVTIGGEKVDFAALSKENIVFMNIDYEKGEWLADEDMIGTQAPLWFSETTHRVSPVYKLEKIREAAREILPDNLKNIDINPILVVSAGNIINADEMSSTWSEKQVFITRFAGGSPLSLDDISSILEEGTEEKPSKSDFEDFKKALTGLN